MQVAHKEIIGDQIIQEIAEYALHFSSFSKEALETAHLCLVDSLGCALLALNYPACTKLLGPVLENESSKDAVFVLGTQFHLDPIRAAFNIGVMVRWLDYNDTWLAFEWGHPSDNLGALISCCAFKNLSVLELLQAMIKAHEIQGVLALKNSFNRLGIDHVILVKIASAAVSAAILGGGINEVKAAISQAFIDLGPLRTYRHAPNTGSRKSWAAGDATSRGMQLAWMSLQGEMGYETPLTAPIFGFQDTLLRGNPLVLERSLENYVMENILFKVSYPAEFHAQTAVEAMISLYLDVKDKVDEIEKITIWTHESAIRIIDKKGPLKNPADRDHCLQYMVAIALIYGELNANHYEDEIANNPLIDILREKMEVLEDPIYTKEYLDPDKRSIANAIQVSWKDGTKTDKKEVHYPLGHRRRRRESIPSLLQKFHSNLKTRFSQERVEQIESFILDREAVEKMSVRDFLANFSLEES